MVEPSDVAEVIQAIQDDVTTIVKGEIALATEELKGEVAKAGVIAGLFGGAGYVAFSALAVLFSAFAFAWAVGFQAWFNLSVLSALFWGFLVMAVLMLLIAAVMGLIGSRAPKPGAPTQSIADAKEQVAHVSEVIRQASAEVSAQPIFGARSSDHPELD